MPAALFTKLGPLPAWAWGLLVGVGVLGYAYLHRSSSPPADATTADGTQGAGTDAGTPADLSSLDQSAPLDFAGPTSGAFGGGDSFAPAPPTSLRIDPAQWARLQKELRQIQKDENRRNPKHKKKSARPHVATASVRQPNMTRPRQTGVTVSTGQLP
jgi:hypothetical protein